MKSLVVTIIALIVFCIHISAQTTTFTYQGKLTESSAAANGTFDMQFRLLDNPNAGQGTQIGTTFTNSTVAVANGIFSVQLDFGSPVFASGADLYLEISLRPAGNTGGFTSLAPRQRLTSSPFTIRALSAASADNATTANTAINSQNLGGTAANQFVLTNDTRLSDARQPTAGSGLYIQNSTSLQPTSNFNVNGAGSANIFNATTQYNINGSRVLSIPGSANLFVGVSVGASNTTGTRNSFFGSEAGNGNTSGKSNVFVGRITGFKNTEGNFNAFFGETAGFNNLTGNNNSFFGAGTGGNSATGNDNSFFGAFAGQGNTSGSNNTLIGTNANVSVGSLSFATAIGAGATVSTSNTVVFGRAADTVKIPGSGQADGMLSADTVNADREVKVNGNRVLNIGNRSPGNNTIILGNTFVGINAGGTADSVSGGNSFFGASAGNSITSGSNNTIIGNSADVGTGTLSFATAVGAGATVSTSNTITLGRTSDTVFAPNLLKVNTLGAAGSTSLCRNSLDQISTCTTGNLAEDSSETKTEINLLREQVKQQELVIAELKLVVCSIKPDAAVCKK